jgi:hypothetical protein
LLSRFSGVLSRVPEAGPADPVLVNGDSVTFPAIHAKGVLTNGAGDQIPHDFWFLDDPLGAYRWRIACRAAKTPDRLSSAINRDVVRTASRSSWLETILVMKTAQNRSGDDAEAIANPMATQHRRDVWALRNAWSQAPCGRPRWFGPGCNFGTASWPQDRTRTQDAAMLIRRTFERSSIDRHQPIPLEIGPARTSCGVQMTRRARPGHGRPPHPDRRRNTSRLVREPPKRPEGTRREREVASVRRSDEQCARIHCKDR